MFCKAEVCSTPFIQWFVVGAITVQDLYCITMPEVTMQKGYGRILDLCNKAGRVIPWWKQMRGCLSAWPRSQHITKEHVHSVYLPILPMCSPFGWGMQSSCQEDGVKPAYGVLGQARCPPARNGQPSRREGSRERGKRRICCTFSAPATPVPDVFVTGQSAAFSWWDWAAREKLLGAGGCQQCRDEERYGLQRLVSPPVNLSGFYPFLLLHLEFPLTGGFGTQL